jgi:hypothetical protein
MLTGIHPLLRILVPLVIWTMKLWQDLIISRHTTFAFDSVA